MIGIASQQSVHWQPAPAVAPGASVAPVARKEPVQRTSGDPQSGLGSERNLPSQTTQKKPRESGSVSDSVPQAAPLLPRGAGQDGAKSVNGEEAQTVQDRSKSAKEVQELAAEKALKLLEVLSTVWKASAAVVDDMLNKELGASGEPGQEAPAGAGGKNGANHAANGPAPHGLGVGEEVAQPGKPAGDPVVYTEHGTSAWMAIETGQLVRQKV